LQAIALLIGQAAGTLAATAAKENIPAEKVSVRKVQNGLLQTNAYIMPYFDVPLSHPHFEAVQKIGATGILKGQGVPTGWANRTYFHPDSLVKRNELVNDLVPYYPIKNNQQKNIRLSEAIDLIIQMAVDNKFVDTNQLKISASNYKWNFQNKALLTQQIQQAWVFWKLGYFNINMPLTRLEFAVLFNATIDPFNLKQVNHQGVIIE
jgi:hypothetical protein